MSDFNDRLIEFKEQKKLSGDALARLCDVSIDSMRKYLQRKMIPKTERQEEILKIIKNYV